MEGVNVEGAGGAAVVSDDPLDLFDPQFGSAVAVSECDRGESVVYLLFLQKVLRLLCCVLLGTVTGNFFWNAIC